MRCGGGSATGESRSQGQVGGGPAGGAANSGGGGTFATKPVPVIVEWEVVYNPLSDNEVVAVIENKGASGEAVLAYTSEGDYSHSYTAYFGGGERRRVRFPLPNAPSRVKCELAARAK